MLSSLRLQNSEAIDAQEFATTCKLFPGPYQKVTRNTRDRIEDGRNLPHRGMGLRKALLLMGKKHKSCSDLFSPISPKKQKD